MTREELNKLIDKYLSGEASPTEERLIDDFFAAAERKQAGPHESVSRDIWSLIWERIGAERAEPLVGERPRKKRSRASVLILAMVVGLLAVSIPVYFFQKADPERVPGSWVTSESPKGQKSLITLADGSRIFINSGTKISYPESFQPHKREVVLEGEAFFEIVRDERRPFTVRSGKLNTQVLGTSFNIEAYAGHAAKVTVATGKVQVEVRGSPRDGGGPSVVLLPGQQAVYDEQQELITKNVDPERFIAWKELMLYFDNSPLDEVATYLERWYNVTIQFDNTRIGNCRVTGKYKEMDLRSVLESIQYMYQIDYRFVDDKSVVLYGKGCD